MLVYKCVVGKSGAEPPGPDVWWDQVPCYVLCTPDYTVMGKKYSVPPGQG